MNIPPDSLSVECGDHKHGVSYTFCRKITQVIEFSVNNRKCQRIWGAQNIILLSATLQLCHSKVNLIQSRILFPPIQFVSIVPPDSRVIRGCGWDDSAYKNKCYQRSGFGGRLEVCACANDNCNGAVSVQSINSVMGVLCPLVILAVFTRFF